MRLKKSCFLDRWKVSSVGPIFKNVGDRSMEKMSRPVTLLFVISKIFEKLINSISSMISGLPVQLQII